MIEEKTTIQLSNKVRDKLKAIGKKGQTYDDIIRMLIDFELKSRDSQTHVESGKGKKD